MAYLAHALRNEPHGYRLNVHRVGRSTVLRNADGVRLINLAGGQRAYTNAQLDDYQGLARRDFLWRPPLRLSLRARFSHDAQHLHGTAGFGFWNDPFLMTGWRWPAPPAALWFFFASPPSDMALALDAPGWGWKAAVIDARRAAALRWLPLTPVIIPVLRSQTLHRHLWPCIQRDLSIAEAGIDGAMTVWRRYEVAWGERATTFWVDGQPVLREAPSPRGPLGLVLWIDNQFLLVHPSGRLAHGVLTLPHMQWVEIDDMKVVGAR
ncbi:MAG: hypothetical protein BroJett021_35520 [Chloroflexota bacterium]|nr:hypothetical protein [Caldilinea sp.]GIK74564.1 MAG: hypothetical protein BroJett021_35520 [Chloroflexota bacterium]